MMWRDWLELAVLACGGDFAEQVFVHVALGIAVGHVDIGQHIDQGAEH